METVRAHLRLAAKIPALTIGPLFVFGPIVGAGWALASIPWHELKAYHMLVAVMLAATGVFIGYHMYPTFDWVEFDGAVLRAKHLYTRRLHTHTLTDVQDIRPLVAAAGGGLGNRVIDAVVGKIRGYEIRVRGRRRGIAFMVGDTAHAAELANAVARAAGIVIKPPA